MAAGSRYGVYRALLWGGGLFQVTCPGFCNLPLHCRYLHIFQNDYLILVVVGGVIIKLQRYVQFRILFIFQDNNFLLRQPWPSRRNQFISHNADIIIKLIFGRLIPSGSSVIKYIFSNISANIPFIIIWGIR